MNLRWRTVLLAVALLVSVVAVGFALSVPGTGDMTYVPDELQGYEQTRNITGPEAKAQIAELHRRSGAVTGYRKAVVADYGPETELGPTIRIYASVYNESEMAAHNITRMVHTMDRSPMFDIQNTTIESRTVHVVHRDEVAFAFFSYRETAYWVSHVRSENRSTEKIVAETIRTNRESRSALPW